MSLSRKRNAGTRVIHPDTLREIIALRKDIISHIKDAARNPNQFVDFDWSDYEDKWDDKLLIFKKWQP